MKRLKDHDFVLTIAVLVLLGLGIMTIYSVTIGTATEIIARRQLLFAIAGLLIYVILALLQGKELRHPLVAFSIYGATLLGMVITMFVGEDVRGATRWIKIGDFSLQFGEFAKVGIVLAVASTLHWLGDNAPELNTSKAPLKDLLRNYFMNAKFLWAIVVALPAIILLALQPSYGTAGIFVVVPGLMAIFAEKDKVKVLLYLMTAVAVGFLLLAIMNSNYGWLLPYAAGGTILVGLFGVAGVIKKRITPATLTAIVAAVAIVGIGGTLIWSNLLKDYHRDRILVFLGSSTETTTNVDDFQTRQALIAIGSGQMDGKGFAQGIQSRLRFLPDYHTDFIFAAYAEEFGFRGVVLLLSLYAGLFFLLARRSGHVDSEFGQSVIEGSLVVLFAQFAINLGMNFGLLPVLGIPLPFFSYGGSTLWSALALVGLAQSFGKKREGITSVAKIRGWQT